MESSIIILTKNGGRKFKQLLEKLSKQSYQDYEIIVIDSGSEDDTKTTAEEYGCRVYEIKPNEFHHSKTRNLGASLSNGKYLIYITQDAIPVNTDFLEILLEPLLNYKDVAAVYGRQIAYNDSMLMDKFFYEFFYPNSSKIISPSEIRNPSEFYMNNIFISDVASAIRKKIWYKVKFDENIIMSEDKKWAYDVLKKGYKIVYEPRAAVYHSHKYTLTGVFKRRFDDGVALRQICGSTGIKNKTGRTYLLNELKYVIKNEPILVLYSLIYSLFKVTGFVLGNYYPYLPNFLRIRFSKHNYWWKNSR